MYKLTNGTSIIRLSDNAIIPADEENYDFKYYLEWVSGGGVAEPADVIPTPEIVVSAFQIRKALNQLNLRTLVENAVAASSDIELKDGWEYATEFYRNNSLVVNLGLVLGKTPEELDSIFELAKTL
jgi:hypothetical protein